LRYTPDLTPDQLRATLQKYGINMGGGRRRQNAQNGGPAATDQAGSSNAQGAGNAMARNSGGNAAEEDGGQAGSRGNRQFARRGGFQGGEDTPGGGRAMRNSARFSGTPTEVHVVWKLGPNKTVVPVQIRTGLTDRTVTQVLQVMKGELKEGDELVIGSTAFARTPNAASPFGGGGRGRGRGF